MAFPTSLNSQITDSVMETGKKQRKSLRRCLRLLKGDKRTAALAELVLAQQEELQSLRRQVWECQQQIQELVAAERPTGG